MYGWGKDLLDDYLAQIAQQDIKERRDALCRILKGIGVAFDLQSEERPINIRVPLHRDSLPYILVGVHYDNLLDSFGANNNASSVAVALGLLRVFHFIQTKKQRPLPLEFVFFDGQESGSTAYANCVDPQRLYAMLNLSLCGVGDTVLMATGKHVANSPVEKAIRRLENSPHQPSLRLVELLPPSSEIAFEALGVPTISVCIVPDDDVLPMIGLAVSMHNREKIALLPAVYEAVQHPDRDTIEAIQVDAMRQVMLIVNSFVSNLLTTMPEGVDWK
jgi:hypothetical protein